MGMMNIVNNLPFILGNVTEIDTSDTCNGLLWLVKLIRQGLFPILQWGIPIILIVLGTIDLGKAVISSDEKQVKEAQGKLVKRPIYAVLVFFIVFIVNFVFSMVARFTEPANVTGTGNMESWQNRWNAAGN